MQQNITVSATTIELLQKGMARRYDEGYLNNGKMYTGEVNKQEMYCQDMSREGNMPKILGVKRR